MGLVSLLRFLGTFVGFGHSKEDGRLDNLWRRCRTWMAETVFAIGAIAFGIWGKVLIVSADFSSWVAVALIVVGSIGLAYAIWKLWRTRLFADYYHEWWVAHHN